MFARPVFLIAALASVAVLSGCDTVAQMESWLPDMGSSTPAFKVTQDQPALEVQFHGVALKSSKIDDAGNEIALQLDGTADAAEFAQVQRRVPDWILGTHTDADTAHIVARHAVAFSTESTADGFVLHIKSIDALAAVAPAASAAAAEQDDPRDGMQRDDMAVVFGVAETPPSEQPPRGSL